MLVSVPSLSTHSRDASDEIGYRGAPTQRSRESQAVRQLSHPRFCVVAAVSAAAASTAVATAAAADLLLLLLLLRLRLLL